MSLVNEALKKARAQSAWQQSPNPRQIAAPPIKPPPVVSGSHLKKLLILVALGALATVGIAASSAIVHRVKTVTATDQNLPFALSSKPVVAPRLTAPTPPAPAVAVATAEPVLSHAETAVAPKPTANEPAPATSAETGTVSPPPPSTTTELVEGKVYLQTIDLPGVPKINLGGILWSAKNPIAMVNGIAAAPGDDLGNVTVLAIEPKRVKLRAMGKDFFIRLP